VNLQLDMNDTLLMGNFTSSCVSLELHFHKIKTELIQDSISRWRAVRTIPWIL